MGNSRGLVYLELIQFLRNRAFLGLMATLFILMALAAWNTYEYTSSKKDEVRRQLNIVRDNDQMLAAEIDSLARGLASYESSYTLPTNGVRLTYNNHRVAHLPFKPLGLIAIGQGDLFSNYKKIVLYFNTSYEMSTEELVSPLEQLFGQLDLAFVWIYLMPLIIILVSFNLLSLERETGRLPLIASQPLSVSRWVFTKIRLRFLVVTFAIIAFLTILLLLFGINISQNVAPFAQLLSILVLYSAFWFMLCFLVNLMGLSSGKCLIVLTSIWVLFVFLIPSMLNQLAKEFYPVPSRLSVINHHQAMYNAMEDNYEEELVKLYDRHPYWESDDPVTADRSNATGWNINYLAKQYMAQIKHRPVVDDYEARVTLRNEWMNNLSVLSPALLIQSGLMSIAGTSTAFYREFLSQAVTYAQDYREYVFQGLFTNHAFTREEIQSLPKFEFNEQLVPNSFGSDVLVLSVYIVLLVASSIGMMQRAVTIK